MFTIRSERPTRAQSQPLNETQRALVEKKLEILRGAGHSRVRSLAGGIDAWAARIEPFLAAGDDVYVFFRHDPVGRAGELALELSARFPGR